MSITYGKVVVKTVDGVMDNVDDAAYLVEDGTLYVFNRDGTETYGFPMRNVMAFGKNTPKETQDA